MEDLSVTRLLSVTGLTKQFKVNGKDTKVLEALDFTLEAGSFLTILGPSGCGKSTLLRCIAGFEPLTGGVIRMAGRKVERPDKDRMVVFQSFDQLFPWLTVLQNITFALQATRTVIDSKARAATARSYLQLVGLSGYADYFPHQISGGMKQRVAITRALSVRPRILLMDEPFGSLDALNRNLLQEELIRIWQNTGVTIIFVTHSIEEAILLSEKILVLETGPGRIRALLTNSIPRPRSPEAPEFTTLWKELHGLLGLYRETGTAVEPQRRIVFEDGILQPSR